MKKIYTLLMIAMAAISSSAQTLVMEQDFNVFTNGSIESPETKVDIATSYSAEHRLGTMLSGWSGSKVYEAGGSLMIADGGNITTAYLNTSTDGGFARMTLDVKCRDSYGGAVQLTVGYSVAGTVILSDDQWHTVEILFTGSSYGKLKVAPYLSAAGIIIDNMKVETSRAFVPAPNVNQPTTATKTNFYASWSRVTGANGYKLNVYSKNGETREYLKQDELVTTTSVSVTGLDAEKTYFFTVKTVMGEYESPESEEIEVVPVYSSIDAPNAISATNISENGFTANWEAVSIADNYSVVVYKKETLAEDQTVTVLDEDFSGVTEGSLNNAVIPSASREYLDKFTKTPGWYANQHVYAAGYMGIYPYATGTITTPAMDLSSNEGAFTLDIKIASNAYGKFYADECKINIYQGESETPVKTIDVTLDGSGFQPFHFDLDCGATTTYIEVEYSGSYKVFIDDVKVQQQKKAGDFILTKVDEKITDQLSQNFDVVFGENISYQYTVQANVRTVVSGEIRTLTSEASNTIIVENTTGITGITDNSINSQDGKFLKNGRIIICKDGISYNIAGQRVK